METLPSVMSVNEVQKVSELMIASGYFKDVRDIAQAAVKIMAGQELGITPIAAMRGIDIVEGQVSIRSHLMGGMIKRSGRYHYVVTKHTVQECSIEFFDRGESCGTSVFTMQDADAAGLSKRQQWQKYPKAMLYNRAMSQGARMFCPDIFLGAVYDEGEIEVQEEKPRRKPGLVAAAVVDTDTNTFTGEVEVYQPLDDIPEPMTEKQRNLILGLFRKGGVLDGDKRLLLDRILGSDGMSLQDATSFIDRLKHEEDRLPSHVFFTYINMLMERYGIGQAAVMDYCREYFGGSKVGTLDADQQRQLTAWLSMSKEYETEQSFDDKIAAWKDAMHVTDETFDSMSDIEIEKAVSAWEAKQAS